MREAETWRALLGQSIENLQERQRIANEMGVIPMTLTRWVNGESTPRWQSLQRLLSVLPEHRERLLMLMGKEFESFPAMVQEEAKQRESTVIPSEFYARVLHTLAMTPEGLLFTLLSDLILQEALEQLDPQRLGVAIIVARCMPPSYGQKVRSLREGVGRGTPPWARDLEQHAIFLGAESLAGYVIGSGHLEVNQDLKDEHNWSPGYRGPWEASAAALPIMRMGKIAGSLLVASTQSNYFPPARCELIEHYAELIALAFLPEDFYEPQQIQLGVVPTYEAQQPYLSRFRPRATELMRQHARSQEPLPYLQAEQIAWQEIEAELLQRPLSSE